MTNEKSLNRRQVLAAVGAVGAAGLTAGVGTNAMLTRAVQTSQRIDAGGVEITADCATCTVTDGGVQFEIDGIEPGSGIQETEFQLRVPEDSNDVRLWLHAACPPVIDPLGETLQVQLFVQNCEAIHVMGSPYRDRSRLLPETGWLTLSELREQLAQGIRIDDPDDPCFESGTERCLLLRYRLPSDANWAVATTTAIEFVVAAEQCRHVDEGSNPSSPLPAEACPDLDCPDCVELGKLDVEGDTLEAGTRYALDQPGYEIEILSVTNKSDDDSTETVCASFRLLEEGSETDAPPICRVTVGGGVPQGSPGSPGGPGNPGGGRPNAGGGPSAWTGSDPEDRVVTYDIEPPSTRTRGELCAAHSEDKSDPESVPDGERPAISNITVFVCNDVPDEPEEPECVSCPDGGERIDSATFEYSGPSETTITIDQQSSGNSPAETVTAPDLDDGETFTAPLNGSGRPDFDVIAETGNETTIVGDFHTSCSQPFGPGTVISDGTYALTVLEAFDKSGNPLCEVDNS